MAEGTHTRADSIPSHSPGPAIPASTSNFGPDSGIRRGASPLLYGLIAVMTLFWSGNFIAGKVALREFPPMLLSGVRVGLAAFFILPFYWWQQRALARGGSAEAASAHWKLSDVPTLAGLGFMGVGLNQFFFTVGLNYTTVAHSAIIIGLTPILVLAVASVIGMEKFTSRKFLGMIVALLGVAVLQLLREQPGSGHMGGRGSTLLGDGLTVLGASAFGLFTIFGKRVSGRFGAVTVNTFAYVCSALLLLPMTLWQASKVDLRQISGQAWLSATYMALCPSVLAYLIYYYALQRIPASRLAAFSYLQPIVAVALAAVLLAEPVTQPVVFSGVLIFSGVFLTESSRSRA